MMEPRYRDIKSAQVPEVLLENGAKIKIICGRVEKYEGPVKDIIIDPEYLDVTVPAKAEFKHTTKLGHTVFAYVIEGQGHLDETKKDLIRNGMACLYADGDHIEVKTAEEPVRFLLISGKPIGESVAWYGPIVMNSDEELQLAFDEYQDGTFIKHKKPSGI
jgi:redox-sensitive bicupin YhaK (pirin superfamily)